MPWFTSHSSGQRSTEPNPDASMSASSSFELLERGNLLTADGMDLSRNVTYAEGTTIDWHREEAVERVVRHPSHVRGVEEEENVQERMLREL